MCFVLLFLSSIFAARVGQAVLSGLFSYVFFLLYFDFFLLLQLLVHHDVKTALAGPGSCILSKDERR